MATILVVASPRTYLASLGAMTDSLARLVQVYQSNAGLRNYSQPHTAIMLTSIDGAAISLAGGRSLVSEGRYSQARDINLVYLPSFEVLDADNLRDSLTGGLMEGFHDWLGAVAKSGVAIGACGAAVGHLAAAGILDGIPAAMDARLERPLMELYSAIRKAPGTLAVSDAIFTATTDADSTLLARRMLDYVLAPSVGARLARSETPVAREGTVEQDPLVAQAKLWLHDHFAQTVRIVDLASRMEVSHQTLIRRFRAAGEPAPYTYLQQVRLESASAMLTHTKRSVSEIAQLVGYADVASFRRKFQAMFGQSPTAFRRARRAERRHAFPSEKDGV